MLLRKDYSGVKEPIRKALARTEDEFDRGNLYDMLRMAAEKTADVPAMVEACEFLLPRQTSRATRRSQAADYVRFLTKNEAIDTQRGKALEKLQQSPNDFLSLAVVVLSVNEKHGGVAPDGLPERFEQVNLAIARKQAQSSEELASRLKEVSASGYATAAKCWADTDDPERVRQMVARSLSAPKLTDSFMLRLQHESLGDALCLIGAFEDGVRHYEQAIAAEESELQKGWLKGKIADAKKGKKPG